MKLKLQKTLGDKETQLQHWQNDHIWYEKNAIMLFLNLFVQFININLLEGDQKTDQFNRKLAFSHVVPQQQH